MELWTGKEQRMKKEYESPVIEVLSFDVVGEVCNSDCPIYENPDIGCIVADCILDSNVSGI